MVSKNWKLFVARLSDFWLGEMLLGRLEKENVSRRNKKNGGNEWAGPPTYKIWGASVSRLKGSTVRETSHHKLQSLVKVPKELLQLQQKVCIGINIFFVNSHIFFVMYSRKICFATITHLINHKVSEVWVMMHKIYQMYMLHRFHVVEIAGDGEFAWIADHVASLPTTSILSLAATSEHVGLVEQNICFRKEKTLSIHHSLPFERVPALMLVHMVLYTMQFMNSFHVREPCSITLPAPSWLVRSCIWFNCNLSLGAIAKVQRMWLLTIALLSVCMGQSLWVHLEICLEGTAFLLWILAS